MKPAPFRYHSAKSIRDAVRILSEIAPLEGRIIAGGQSLIPTMALRMAQPQHLLDINGIDELRHIREAGDYLAVGACVRHAAFEKPVSNNPIGAVLSGVVPYIAHYPIRTRGTFCGSLALADPASEWCCVAATLDATLIAESAGGRREIAAADFFEGIMATSLEPDELLVEARLPLLAPGTRSGFQEFSRRHGDFAIGMSLVVLRLAGDVIEDIRIGTGADEASARRIRNAEAILLGQKPSEQLLAAASREVADSIVPLEDDMTSGGYRRELIETLTFRALQQALS